MTSPDSAPQLPLSPENIEILMIRRKDSMSYTEFMRGKYDVNDSSYVKRLLENMTQTELQRLKSQPFEQLWDRLWNFSDRHEHELTVAQDKFNQVTSIVTSAKSSYKEPEWGFPKGRRFKIETDIQCAQREFMEETTLDKDSYVLVKNVVFSETFLGTNGIPYEHRYFLAVQTNPLNIHQKFTLSQKREISAIGWKTLSDCMALTRPHYSGREILLKSLAKFVSTVEVDVRNVTPKDNGNPST